MENWDESFDFQPIPSDKCEATTSTSSTSAVLPGRHKAYSVSNPPPASIPQQPTPVSNSLPSKHENWDDSYVYDDDEDGDGFRDEDEEDRDDISSLSHARFPPVPFALSSRPAAKSIEDDVESWGSHSDWSGDGDVEDLTRDSFRDKDGNDTLSFSGNNHATDSERQPLPSNDQNKGLKHISAIPRFGRFATGRRPSTSSPAPNLTSNKSDSSSLSTSNTSFLAKISPVNRWKSPVRDGPTPKRSQPFQVNRDKKQSNVIHPSTEPPNALSKEPKKARVTDKKDLTRKAGIAATHQDDVKRRNSKSVLAPSSQFQQQMQQHRNDREKEKEKEKGAMNVAMSPIKRVFSGTPLSHKNTSSASVPISSPHGPGSSFSQTSSSLSSAAIAEMSECGGELREQVAAAFSLTTPSNTVIRRNPPSAPASTMTSPTSLAKHGQGAAISGTGTRTKVRYRSKTTASTSAHPNSSNAPTSLAIVHVQPPKVSLTHNAVLPSSPTRSQATNIATIDTPKNANLSAPRPLSQTPRRSSLNDLRLKIPERISHAQRDIRRDVSDVKEFAACVEQIRNLQHVYAVMLRDLRAVLSDTPVDENTNALLHKDEDNNNNNNNGHGGPAFFNLNLSPKKRRGTVATTAPHVSSSPSPGKTHILKRKFSLAASPPPQPSAYAVALNKLDHTYGIWWECAEVLIELGGSWKNGASGAGVVTGNTGSNNINGLVDVVTSESGGGLMAGRRVRAVTLGSDAGAAATIVGVNVSVNVDILHASPVSSTPTPTSRDKETAASSTHNHQTSSSRLRSPPQASPPKPSQWRATTGRAGNGRDLTPRQLEILQDMIMADEERDGQLWDPKPLDFERSGLGGDATGDGVGGSGGGLQLKKKGLREFWSGLRKGGGNVVVSASTVVSAGPRDGVDDISISNPTSTPTSSPTRGSTSFDSSVSPSESNHNNPTGANVKKDQRKSRYDKKTHDPTPSAAGPGPGPGLNRVRSPRTPSPSKRTVTAATAGTGANVNASGLSRGKKSLRRPSLAGLFGMGQRNSSGGAVNFALGTGASSSSKAGKLELGDGSSSDWDWDMMEVIAFDDPVSASVSAASASAVRKGARKDTTMVQGISNSQKAVYESSSSAASPDKDKRKKTSHSHFQIEDEIALSTGAATKKPSLQLPRAPPVFLSSDEDPLMKGGDRKLNVNFLRSPAGNIRIHSDVSHKRDRDAIGGSSHGSSSGVPVAKLALTPDNIRPLLRRAREIAAHLNECIGEVRGMMGGVAVI